MAERLIRITAHTRSQQFVPLNITLRDLEAPADGAWALEDTQSGERLDLQPESGWYGRRAWLRFVLPEIRQGQSRTFRLVSVAPADARAQVNDTADNILEMTVDGRLVTRYHHDPKYVRPFMWPLIGPDGVELTRSWPIAEPGGEQTDHVHHRSVWSAHGDLNGHDNWLEEGTHGGTKHESFEEKTSGPVFCRFSTHEDWVSAGGARVLRAYRDLTAYTLPDEHRVLDYTICFRASEGDVRFGDTKEGGLLAVRMATALCGENGGVIENAYGGRTERECWGRPAPWVDYSGQLGDATYGIAIFDHPDNPCYPTRWHVRNYGLFTANPFALHDYLGTDEVDGSRVLENGQVWRFAYRMFLHRGDAAEAGVRDKFMGYAAPPEVEAVTE